MKALAPLFALAILLTGALAQAPTTPSTPRPSNGAPEIPLFRAKLPGGTYEVALRSIVAVAIHEYLVDGIARVTEVNIDTSGSLLARFYYLEPATPNTPLGLANAAVDQAQRLLKEAAEKTGQDVWKKVVKNYPTTTHARTVEYRVESLEQLNYIYQHAESAFRLQRDTRISVGE